MLRKSRSAKFYLAPCLALLAVCGCGEDDPSSPPTPMVTVRGVVRNVDTFGLAEGVRISLLDTGFADVVATGTTGAYSIEVPQGSELVLLADDFDTSSTDVWFPLINVDVPARVANENIDGWDIHACPQTVAPGCGSVAMWDDYLENHDAGNGDLFVPTSTASSAGAVSVLFGGCDGAQLAFHSDMTVTTSAPQFPMHYVRFDCSPFGNGLCPQANPPCIHPSTRVTTDTSGWAVSFGDPTFIGDTLELTFTDTDAVRDFQFESPFEIPVRPGTISLVWVLTIDDVENQWFPDVGQQCIFPPSSIVSPGD